MLAAKLAAATPQQLYRIEHPGDIYGVSLDEAVSRSDPEGESPTGRVTHNWCCLTGLVPYQITHLCQWIEKNALAVEGIFRSAACRLNHPDAFCRLFELALKLSIIGSLFGGQNFRQ